MKISKTKLENRVVFLDNLRWLFVVFVILEHSSNAYRSLNWWPVADKATSIIAGWVSAFSDASAMPLLFYIAGYFAIPTIDKKGTFYFLKGKLEVGHSLAGVYFNNMSDFTLGLSFHKT